MALLACKANRGFKETMAAFMSTCMWNWFTSHDFRGHLIPALYGLIILVFKKSLSGFCPPSHEWEYHTSLISGFCTLDIAWNCLFQLLFCQPSAWKEGNGVPHHFLLFVWEILRMPLIMLAWFRKRLVSTEIGSLLF